MDNNENKSPLDDERENGEINNGTDIYNQGGNYNGYSPYYAGGYGYAPKAKSSKLLIVILSIVSALLVASIIGIGIIYNQIIVPLLNEIEPENSSSPQLPVTSNVIDEDFNLSQSSTPGAKYTSLADAYDATYKIFAEINTSSETDGSMGAGSGFIVARMKNNKGYYIVTNNHVVEGATKITVRLSNGKEYTAASTVLRDEYTDLAVIAIGETEELQVAKLGKSSDIRVGEDVYVIGNPLGTLAGTLTNGIVSSKAAEIYMSNHQMKLIQTTAAINPGNSGGPIFNMSGEVIGIVNSKYAGTGIEGLGFAIPMDTAIKVINDMVKQGYVTGRHDLGITMESNLYGTGGLWISEIEKDSSFTTALVAAGITPSATYAYQILTIGGYTFESVYEANAYIDKLSPGDEITIAVDIYELYFNRLVKAYSKTLTFELGQKLATN